MVSWDSVQSGPVGSIFREFGLKFQILRFGGENLPIVSRVPHGELQTDIPQRETLPILAAWPMGLGKHDLESGDSICR